MFRPAVALLNRLNYPRKFLLLSGVLLLPLAVAMPALLNEQQEQIHFAREERQGLQLLRPIQAYSIELLLSLKRSSNPASLEQTWQSLLRARRDAGGSIGGEGLVAEIQRIRTDPSQFGAARINERAKLDEWRNKIAGESNLILDPMADGYYLVDILVNRIPRIQDDLALIGSLVEHDSAQTSPAIRSQLIYLASDIRGQLTSLKRQTLVAFDSDRSRLIAVALAPALQRLEADLAEVIQPLDLLMIKDQPLDTHAVASRSQATLLTANRFWQRTAAQLDSLIERRIEALQAHQRELALVVFLALGLALYLFIGFYRSTMATVESLRQAARHMMASGQAKTVELQSRDEMASVVRSFNTVAEALRQAEANYRGIVENALEGIYQASASGQFRMANPRLAEILGYSSPSDLCQQISNPATQLHVNPDRYATFMAQMEQQGSVVEFESEVTRQDGSRIWISESARAVRNPAGQIEGVEGTVVEITQRKRDAAEIERLTTELKSENRRMGAELEVTRRLQAMLMPSEGELTAVPDLDIAGFMEPAEEVGGDYYDIQQANGRLRFSIGDVTGHGLESSLVMIMAQTAVRTLLSHGETDPAKLLSAVNRTIYDNTRRMGSAKSMTLSLLEYDAGTLRLSGQHEELILVRADGSVEQVDTFELGFPLGIELEIGHFVQEQQLSFASGDVAVLYTDGITEAMNAAKEQYGIDRMLAVVQSSRAASASMICKAIVDDLRRWMQQEPAFDDITLLVLKQP